MRILPLLCASAALYGAPALRSGWVFVPGAGDLVQSGQWSCTSGLTATGSALTISAATNFNTVTNTSGPVLKTPGDFSVLATLSAAPGASVWLTLVGTPATGPEFWRGLKRLDAGIAGGSLSVNYWMGASSSATGSTYPLPSATGGAIDLEVARIGSTIVLFVGGEQVGSFDDPGLFASGQVYLGFNVAPQNTLTVTSMSAAMPSGGSATFTSQAAQVAERSGTGLRDAAEKSGLLIGAAVNPSYFSESKYVQALGREFNLAVPENDMKFGETEPAPHKFSFCRGDQIVNFARANGMLVRGHNLVWQQDLPAWLTGGGYTAAQAADLLHEHIQTVMTHYKGQLIDWDVVNEAIAYGSPYGPQPSYWLNQLGSGYVEQAFRWAHEADPNAKLFYNDTGGEGLGAKSDAVYNLVAGLVQRGVPIHGVGLQAHFSIAGAPSVASMKQNMARFAALELEVHITEMDVRVPVNTSGTPSASDAALQATIYQNVMTACQASPNCTATLTWGVSDAHSWIPGSYPGFGAALLLDSGYNNKPAYSAVLDALNAASAAPIITPGGVTIHAASSTLLSPGSLADIYGNALAAKTETAASLPLGASLGNVQVTVNGTAAPLYFVSGGQIVFQVPYATPAGPALVQVTSDGVPGLAAAVLIQTAAPSILTYGNNWAIAQNQDAAASLNSATNCAAAGSYLTVYLIGSGPLDNPIATGAAASSNPVSREALDTTATIGGIAAPVAFAGMTPGAVGLMQVNVQAPNVSGTAPLQIQVGSFASNTANVCIAAR